MSANVQPLCNYTILKLMILALIRVSALILTIDWDFDNKLLFLFKSSLITYLIQLTPHSLSYATTHFYPFIEMTDIHVSYFKFSLFFFCKCFISIQNIPFPFYSNTPLSFLRHIILNVMVLALLRVLALILTAD